MEDACHNRGAFTATVVNTIRRDYVVVVKTYYFSGEGREKIYTGGTGILNQLTKSLCTFQLFIEIEKHIVVLSVKKYL